MMIKQYFDILKKVVLWKNPEKVLNQLNSASWVEDI